MKQISFFKDRNLVLDKETSLDKFLLMDHKPEVSGVALDTVFHTKLNIHLVKCPMNIDHLDPSGLYTMILFLFLLITNYYHYLISGSNMLEDIFNCPIFVILRKYFSSSYALVWEYWQICSIIQIIFL